MMIQRVKQLSILSHWPVQSVVAIGAGLVLGVVALQFSPLWALIALASVGGAFVILRRPEIGLLSILFATSTIIHEASLPRISIGIGTVYITDVLLLGLLGSVVIRVLAARDFKIIRTPLDLPLFAFYAIAMLSTLNALLQSPLTLNESLGEIRRVSSYLTFFIVTNLVRKDHQIRALWRGILLLTIFVAAGMIAQYLLGTSVTILPGRVETLGTGGVTVNSVTRIIPPGESLALVSFMTLTTILILDELKLAHAYRFLLWGLAGLAVLMTFYRHYYVVVGLALVLLAYLGRGQRHRLFGGGLFVTLVTIVIVLLFNNEPGFEMPPLLRGISERLGSLTNSQSFEDPNSSLRWRDFEYQYAWPQIVSHPLIGLGLGAQYRPFVPGRDWTGFDGRGYIHNGHLYVMLKSGLLAYFCLAWLSVAGLWRGLKYWRLVPDIEMKAIVLGFTLTYLGVLISSIVSPILVNSNWTPVIGILLGLNEVILQKTVREKG